MHRVAIDVLQDQIVRPDVVDLADVRMVQRSDRTRFLLESVEAIGVGRERRWQHLDRDLAPQSRITSAVHLAHAARADRRENLVRTEPGA